MCKLCMNVFINTYMVSTKDELRNAHQPENNQTTKPKKFWHVNGSRNRSVCAEKLKQVRRRDNVNSLTRLSQVDLTACCSCSSPVTNLSEAGSYYKPDLQVMFDLFVTPPIGRAVLIVSLGHQVSSSASAEGNICARALLASVTTQHHRSSSTSFCKKLLEHSWQETFSSRKQRFLASMFHSWSSDV